MRLCFGKKILSLLGRSLFWSAGFTLAQPVFADEALLKKVIAPTPIGEASVQVFLQNPLGENRDLLHGGNNIYPQGAQGLFDEEKHIFDANHLKISESLGFKTYRFPGGSEGNLYHWKRAIGPYDQREPTISGNNRGPQTNEFGSDEFGQLLEKSSFSEGIIMVPYAYEKPEDAADWVEYMNTPVGQNPNGGIAWANVRAKNGHPKPYNIKYWEIGNEVYGNWELNWGSYPHRGDAVRGSANVPVDTKRNIAGTLPFGDAERYIFGGTQYFESQALGTRTSWKNKHTKSTGQADQIYYVKFPPVSTQDVSKPFALFVGKKRWKRVNDFSKSTQKSHHYLLDEQSGKITFGDGKKGKIPAKGKTPLVSYHSGPQPGFVEYYQKMKAVDPSIKVISCFEKESFYRRMAQHNLPYDGVSLHYYPWFIQKWFTNLPQKRKYRSAIASGMSFSDLIQEHLELQERYKNTSLSGKEKFWISEYGVRGLAGAAAAYHTLVNKHLNDIEALLVHSLFLDNNTPAYAEGGVVNSKAYVIAAFSRYSFDYFLKTAVDSKEYTWKMGSHTTRVPRVLSTASMDKLNKNISVILTNTRDTHDVDVTLDFPDTNIDWQKARVQRWEIGSTTADVMAENTLSDQNRFTMTSSTKTVFSVNQPINVPKGKMVILHISDFSAPVIKPRSLPVTEEKPRSLSQNN